MTSSLEIFKFIVATDCMYCRRKTLLNLINSDNKLGSAFSVPESNLEPLLHQFFVLFLVYADGIQTKAVE